MNEKNILTHAGKIAHETAKELAELEYDKFHSKRTKGKDKQGSDFDKLTKQIAPHRKNYKKERKKSV